MKKMEGEDGRKNWENVNIFPVCKSGMDGGGEGRDWGKRF